MRKKGVQSKLQEQNPHFSINYIKKLTKISWVYHKVRLFLYKEQQCTRDHYYYYNGKETTITTTMYERLLLLLNVEETITI